MELWFIYALLSALFAGLFNFGLKVIAEKKFNSSLLTLIMMGVVATLSLTIGIYSWKEFQTENWILPTVLAVIFGIMMATVYLSQVKALKYIDTTIFYPIYKITGPLLVLVSGVFLLSESLTALEYTAIIISLLIPLLLINKTEDRRQGNLKKGLQYLLLTSIITSSSIIIAKIAINTGFSIWLLVFIQNISGILTNIFLKIWMKEPITISQFSNKYLKYGIFFGLFMAGSNIFLFLALQEGLVSIVYTIQSIYILIPIILAIWFYKEHINLRKIIAIMLSIVALILFQI